MKTYHVYIMANHNNNVLYIGVTSNLVKRIYEHRTKAVDGFTKKYNVNKLVYFEATNSIEEAILREKRMKKWKRRWKDNLIESGNPEWLDLYDEII
jgi:putative endonuclease